MNDFENGVNPLNMLGGIIPTPQPGEGVVYSEEELKAMEENKQEEIVVNDTIVDDTVTDHIDKVKDEEEDKSDKEVAEEVLPVTIPRIARFEKVSFEEFCRVYKPIWIDNAKAMAVANGEDVSEGFAYNEEEFISTASALYDNIQLPVRSTAGSAGYDFIYPYGRTEIVPNSTLMIPTGIKCAIAPGWMLMEVPKSGLGFKYRLQMDNTVGIVDSDYYNNKSNEGHIMIKITNDSRNGYTCVLDQGNKYCQGIFVPFGITEDDDADGVREGGFGSTGR